jgi:hypothetical protein
LVELNQRGVRYESIIIDSFQIGDSSMRGDGLAVTGPG